MTLIQGIDVPHNLVLRWLHETALLANEATLEQIDGQWHANGDAVDCALLIMAKKDGFTREQLLKDYQPRACIAYESQQKCSASIYEKDDKTYVFVKGAVEALLPMCAHQMDSSEQLFPLNISAITEQEHELSGQQYRVLSFAYGEIEPQAHYALDDLHNLTFLGMVGLSDPLREEAAGAVAACQQAGIDVVMITGDHPDTAYAISKELALTSHQDEVVTGKQLDAAKQISESDVDTLTKKSKVYARVEPGQKLDIVDSLIRSGHFVAVTGDGVNDAPALKNAHVGVAMGLKGTDVARESADIIITDDNFASILSGIEEGRTAYANIRKIIFFLICTSLAEVCMFLGAIMMALPIPLFATQILWLNFATSIIQDIALAFDPPAGDELKRPPRDPKEAIFDQLMIRRIALTAGVMGMLSLGAFYWMLEYGNYSVVEARNMLLLLFVLFENVIVLNSRSEDHSLFSRQFMANPLLIYGTLVAQAIHIVAMYTPGLRDVLFIQPVSLTEWAALLLIALIPMVVIEGEKWLRRRAVSAG